MATKPKQQPGNFLHVRMERREINKCEIAAKTLGLSLSAWIRMVAIQAAKKQKEQSKEE